MTTTTAPRTSTPPAAVLAFARDRRAAADAAEADLLQAAVTWADLHPAESIHEAALLSRYGEHPLAVAGPGAPLVAEFAVAEFAAAVGMPTETGKAYLGEALELRHRLPQTWARVQTGDLAAWRARRIARATIGLSPAAAGFVDDQVAPFAHRIRPSAVWTGWWRRRSSGSCPPRPAAAGRPPRTAGTPTSTPTRCPSRAPCGSRPRSTSPTPSTSTPPSRSVPRGWPTSDPPRRWTSAAPKPSARSPATSSPSTSTPGTRRRAAPKREVVLHVHLSDQAITGSDDTLHLARVANTRSFVDADQVRDWCNHPGAQVTVKPIIDLTEHIHVDPVRGPRPARRPDRAPRPHLRVPVVHPPRRGLRQGPRHPVQPRAGRRPATTRQSLPTSPPAQDPPLRLGLHRSSNPGPTCGPHPTATSSSATTPAPPTSPTTASRRTSSDTAPHPARPRPRGATGMSQVR